MNPVMNITSPSRRHDLDWLRVLGFGTLILYHVGMFYVTWGWHVKSDHSSTFLEPAMALVNPWRLGLLFFISGAALRFLLDSRGARSVAADRIRRLLLPLGFGMLVVVMPQAYFEFRAKGEIEPGLLPFFGQYLSPFESFSTITPTWNHLWFLAYLLVYSLLLAAAYPLLRRVVERVGPAVASLLDRAPLLVLLVPALLLVLVAVALGPLFPSTHMMINDWADHAHYLTIVLIGWFAAKSPSFWAALRASLMPALVLAPLLGGLLLLTRFGGEAAALLPVVRELYAWTVIALVLALGQRFLSRPSRALGYATEAVLPWFILHQTIIIALGYLFIGSGAQLWVEAGAVVLGTLIGCFALHELLIRRIGWLRPLFGLKPTDRITRRAASEPALARLGAESERRPDDRGQLA